MTLNVNRYGSNDSQRLGKEPNTIQGNSTPPRRTEDNEEALVHITPSFRHTRTASALANGALGAAFIGLASFIPKIVGGTLPKWYNLAAIGATAVTGLFFGADGYFSSKGPVKEAKYDYEMKNDVDLIPVKGSDGYQAVYNDHKIEKKLNELEKWVW